MVGYFDSYLRENMKKLNLYMVISILTLIVSTSVYSQDAKKGMSLYKACIQCHGDKGLGNPKEEAPRIAGQYDWYILSQLKAFKNGTRTNEKMMPYIKDLSVKDFSDLASYVSTLK